MKRRSFLQLLGIAPAAAVAPTMAQAAEKVLEKAAPPAVEKVAAPVYAGQVSHDYTLCVTVSVCESPIRISGFKRFDE